jgi:hypothetical protein
MRLSMDDKWTLEEAEVTILKNGQSRETDKIWHKKQYEDKQKRETTQNTKNMSYKWEVVKGKQFLFLLKYKTNSTNKKMKEKHT